MTPAERRSWPLGELLIVAAFFLSAFACIFSYGGQRFAFAYGRNPYATDVSFLEGSAAAVPGWGDSNDNIVWLLQQVLLPQISDTHIKKDDSDVSNVRLKQIVNDVIPAGHVASDEHQVQPAAVIVTGDITHSKYHHRWGKFFGDSSGPSTDEWYNYRNITSAVVNVADVWVELRGNHDTFGSGNRYGHYDLFGSMAPSVRQGDPRVIEATIERSFGTYRLVSIDASLDPGPFRPFNFFGWVSRTMVEDLRETLRQTKSNVNRTVLFGHYPSSTLRFEDSTLNNFAQALNDVATVSAYLSGHLHSAYGHLLLGMRALARDGSYLELESPDVWTSSRFRLLVFDHDVFSDHVLEVGKWPIVVVTNPLSTHSSSTPGAAAAAALSSHIRILLFKQPSSSSEAFLSVYVDGVLVRELTGEHGLNLIPWMPLSYSQGAHKLSVFVDNNVTPAAKVTFSIDGTPPATSNYDRFLEFCGVFLSRTRVVPFCRLMAISGTLSCIALLAVDPSRLGVPDCMSLRRACPAAWWTLVIWNLNTLLGPVFIILGLTPHRPHRAAWITLHGTFEAGSWLLPSSEALLSYFFLSWTLHVPLTWACILTRSIVQVPQALHQKLRVAVPWCLFLWRWTTLTAQVYGASGVSSAFLSPCINFPAIVCATYLLPRFFRVQNKDYSKTK